MSLTPDELVELTESPYADERLGLVDGPCVIVTGASRTGPAPSSLGALPAVVIAVRGDTPVSIGEVADMVLEPEAVSDAVERIAASPRAAIALAVLLRDPPASIEAALAAESAVYSMLQAGPEWQAWADAHHARRAADDDVPTVAVQRRGGELVVTLDRPARHNAISRRLRDDLSAALATAVVDPSIDRVTLRGNGASFCSGGDTGEFGSRPDPATAHAVRLARSPARLLHRLADRTTAYVHGATLGGGIELAAVCHHVVARPDVAIGLPELELGLIPGAGGTVSLPCRIGRQRTAELALTGRRIGAEAALAWGLVDEIER